MACGNLSSVNSGVYIGGADGPWPPLPFHWPKKKSTEKSNIFPFYHFYGWINYTQWRIYRGGRWAMAPPPFHWPKKKSTEKSNIFPFYHFYGWINYTNQTWSSVASRRSRAAWHGRRVPKKRRPRGAWSTDAGSGSERTGGVRQT